MVKNSIYGDYAPSPGTTPATPLAQTWAGHRYGGQWLKPALEPVIVAQVPYAGRPVDSVVQHGAGALNIEGGRIGMGENRSSGGYTGSEPQPILGRKHLDENSRERANVGQPILLCSTRRNASPSARGRCRGAIARRIGAAGRLRQTCIWGRVRLGVVRIGATAPPMAPRPWRRGTAQRGVLWRPSMRRRGSGVVVDMLVLRQRRSIRHQAADGQQILLCVTRRTAAPSARGRYRGLIFLALACVLWGILDPRARVPLSRTTPPPMAPRPWPRGTAQRAVPVAAFNAQAGERVWDIQDGQSP